MPNSADPGTVHLVQGFLGAGKTTFAKRLALEQGAIRLSADELYLRLFADGPSYELDEKALKRLLAVLNGLWPEIVRAGVDVVLDFGFWRRSLRDEVRTLAAAVSAPTRHYSLSCPDHVALARCLARNGTPDTFLISEPGYHALKARFEPPGRDELVELVDSSAVLAQNSGPR